MSNLNRTWHNELGSKMKLLVTNNQITGTYHSKVGSAYKDYLLVGRTNTPNSSSIQSVGFTVSWENKFGNSNSVTTWSGQYQINRNREIIVTTWLLTRQTSPNNNWQSTIINKDIFTRNAPSEEQIQQSLKRGVQHSHPHDI